MPKYSYRCAECDHRFFIRHGVSEILSKCPKCNLDNSLIKEINKVSFKKQDQPTNNKVGDLTKKFIEDNREVLDSYKQELREKEYCDVKDISS